MKTRSYAILLLGLGMAWVACNLYFSLRLSFGV